MDFLTAYAIYMTVAILIVGLWAARVPHEDVKIVFILALIWPLTVISIGGLMLLNASGWDMDMAKGATWFGFRLATNPKMKGFAVTVLKQEFQFYTKRRMTPAEVDAEIDRLHK